MVLVVAAVWLRFSVLAVLELLRLRKGRQTEMAPEPDSTLINQPRATYDSSTGPEATVTFVHPSPEQDGGEGKRVSARSW